MMRLILFLGLTMCSMAQALDTQRAKELNNQAVKMVNESMGDRKVIKLALHMLDDAIKADSFCVYPYLTKVNFLMRERKRTETLKVLDRVAAIHPEKDGFRAMQGHILECMGRKKDAQKRYLQDLAKYDTMLITHPDSTHAAIRIARAFLLMFIKGRAAGIREYEKIASEYPSDSTVAAQRMTFYVYDKKKFMNDFCN